MPNANLLWKDLHTRASEKRDGKTGTKNICIQILISGISEGANWKCGFEFDYANQESFYCRPLRLSEDAKSESMPVPSFLHPIDVAFLPPMSGLAATEDSLLPGTINVRIGEGRTAEVLRNLCYQVYSSNPEQWEAKLKTYLG